MPRKSRKNVGLIGLGIIGTRVAATLRSAGYHVFVWSRTPKAVPNFLGSPVEIAEICEVIQIFVTDAQAVIDTIESFGEALTSNHVIINCSTIGPEATKEAARLVQQKGAAFLDAPFTGSKIAAEKGQLCYYIGGDDAVFQRVKPTLEATSRAIVKCGKVGDAATLKVATNLITAVTTQTLAEALAIVQKSGIAPEVFAAAIEQNACKSGAIELKLPKMVRGDFEPHFSLRHMFKDVQLGIHIANAFDLEIPVTTVTAGVMYGAMNNGWADLDYSSIFRIYADGQAEQKMAALPAAAEAAKIEDRKEPAAPVFGEAQVVEAQVVEATIIELPTPSSAETKEESKPDEDIFKRVEPPKSAAEAEPVKSEKPAAAIGSIPDIFTGDVFKRRANEDQSKTEVSPADVKPEISPETSPEAKPELAKAEVIEPEPVKPEISKPADSGSDIPEVIFGRAVPMTRRDEQPKEEKTLEAKPVEAKVDTKIDDLEKTVVPPPSSGATQETPVEASDAAATKSETTGENTADEKLKVGPNGKETKPEETSKEEERPRFRPLQRIRRFFSPAGK